jgi:hypothetical protein
MPLNKGCLKKSSFRLFVFSRAFAQSESFLRLGKPQILFDLFWRILSRLSIATPHFSPLGKRIKMQAFIAFAAQKFCNIKNYSYLCT